MKAINRLKKSSDFQKIIQKGKSFKSDSLSVFHQNAELPYVRIGISVSKRLGNAVKRNKIKRQIRAIIAECVDYTKKKDVVIIARSQYDTELFSKMKAQLITLLGKVGITK